MKLSFFYFVATACGTAAFKNHYLSSLTTKTEISAVTSDRKNKGFPTNDYFESLMREEENEDDISSSSQLSPTAKYMAAIEKKGDNLDIDKFLGEMEAYLVSVSNNDGAAKTQSPSSHAPISKMEEYLQNINDDQSFFDAISELSTIDIPTTADIPIPKTTTITSSASVDHSMIGTKMMPTPTATTTAYPSSKVAVSSSTVVTPSGYITTTPTIPTTTTTTTDDDDDIVAILNDKIISKKQLKPKQKYALTHVDTTFLGLLVACIASIPFFNDLNVEYMDIYSNY